MLASAVVPGLPMTSLSRLTPLAAIWKRAVSGQAVEDAVSRPAHVVYSVAPSVSERDILKMPYKVHSSGRRTVIELRYRFGRVSNRRRGKLWSVLGRCTARDIRQTCRTWMVFLLTQSIKDPTLWSTARYPPPVHMLGANLVSIQQTFFFESLVNLEITLTRVRPL